MASGTTNCFGSDLTSITFDCNVGNIGGIDEFYLIPAPFFSASTVVAGEITSIILSGTHKFSKYEIKEETSNYAQANPQNLQAGTGVFNQTITIVLHRNTPEKRQALLEITNGQAALVVLVKDALGQYCLFGRDTRKVHLTNDDATSGTASEDMNGRTLTFTCKSLTPFYFVDDAIVAALLN